MKVINITEEQRDKLCSELARLTFDFKKIESIECIYFAPYKGLGSIAGNVLDVTLVRDGSEDDDLDEKIIEYNLSHQEHDFIQEFGFQILLEDDETTKYTLMDLHPSECVRSNNLLNSTILYDKNGKYTQIKEQIPSGGKNNGFYYYYDNLAGVFPPLTETLNNAMDDARDERDAQAVREFTKSRLFQHIVNM